MESKFAYVTLVMINPEYIMGAITLANSLKLTNTKNDIICMVTNDIYNVTIYRNILLKYFTHVIEIEYVQFKTKTFKTVKYTNLYKWIDKSYTKLTAMKLEQYEKVCMLDCDMIITNNIDNLFELNTPIGVFSNHYFDNVTPSLCVNKHINKTCNYYNKIKPLETIHPELIKKALNNNGFVCSGNIIIIKPNKDEFIEMKKIICKNQPFGFNCSSGADEQCISYYQSVVKSRLWTCLKQPYNVVPWKLKETLLKDQKPYIIHFNKSPKPWNTIRNKWVDNEIWWTYFINIPDYEQIFKLFQIKYLESKIEYCPYCYITLNQKKNHKLLNCSNLIIL